MNRIDRLFAILLTLQHKRRACPGSGKSVRDQHGKYYAGEHQITIQINGLEQATAKFHLAVGHVRP